MRQLTRELNVGTCCGKCLPEAKAALSACVAQRDVSTAHGTAVSSGAASPAFLRSPAVEFAL